MSTEPSTTKPGLSRRNVVKYGTAWTVPVVLFAVASPQAAASGESPGPQPSLCDRGLLTFAALEGADIHYNSGNGFNEVPGTGLIVTNNSTQVMTLSLTLWTSAKQDALIYTSSGDLLISAKDGNEAGAVITLDPGTSRTFRIRVTGSKANAHLVIDCGRFHFDSSDLTSPL